MSDLKWLYDAIAGRTPGPWALAYWAGQCHLAHQHGRGKCKYDYALRTDSEISHNRISQTDPDSRIEVVTTTDEYGAMTKDDATFIATMGTCADDIAAVLRATDAQDQDQLANARYNINLAQKVHEALASLAAKSGQGGMK